MKYATLIIIPLLALALSACSLLQDNTMTARGLVEYSTLKVIDGDDDKRKVVVVYAQEALDRLDTAPQETIPALVTALADRVPWDRMDAADTALVRTLLGELERRLVEKYGPGTMNEDARLAAQTVARWVIQAAMVDQ